MMMEVDVGFVLGSVLGTMLGVALALLIESSRIGRIIEDYNALEQEIWAWEDTMTYDARLRRHDDGEQMDDQRTS